MFVDICMTSTVLQKRSALPQVLLLRRAGLRFALQSSTGAVPCPALQPLQHSSNSNIASVAFDDIAASLEGVRTLRFVNVTLSTEQLHTLASLLPVCHTTLHELIVSGAACRAGFPCSCGLTRHLVL